MSNNKPNFPEGFKCHDKRPHGSSIYMLPANDEVENDRLVDQHYVYKSVFTFPTVHDGISRYFSPLMTVPTEPSTHRNILGGNFIASIDDALEEGISVLDAGCGAGVWCVDMATDYPASTFVGIDNADVLLRTDLPPNCEFRLADTLEGLPFEDDTFDYVFQRYVKDTSSRPLVCRKFQNDDQQIPHFNFEDLFRLMTLAFKTTDWQKVVNELVRVTKPGGYIELIEGQLKFEEMPPSYRKFYNALAEASLARGIELTVGSNLNSFLASAGMCDITSDYVSCPLGWGGRIGQICLQNAVKGIHALQPALAHLISDSDYEEIFAKITEEAKVCRTWSRVNYAFGMKPTK
ncbi:S-adenosyl-L-methionine-dependent methyltransferase [Jimgerdemannia flammicorona]|uniref:S-adenosyl-L-methionine-dependent methyltransferase n=1 Tax=Jimgerdemannia flammicorona TaxID=994334 RepID=A0A433D5V8_9FUNG|nr:S-adenosyl-L-methionine-dependent methyltransferase [Jimgerdemannia flammicorona]